jgi:maltooligosyltrehalose trehalohydrolase
MATHDRRVSLGAELVRGGAHFRVLAPRRRRVGVVLEGGGSVALEREAGGTFAAFVPGVRAGARYRLRLDGEDQLLPDPASRFQPEGREGPSEIVDPRAYAWSESDRAWRGVEMRGQVVYELHVGTFTRDGTYLAAARELDELARVGVTLIELMPVAEFPGRFGWGYDGVDLYAPSHLYGRPDELRAFVDRAHGAGLGVLLDVVYNHLGPSGNYLARFSDRFFTKKYDCEWGDAIDFETDPLVRAFFVENAAYWIDEYHFDGLRLDATQCVFDASPRHVLAESGERARAAARGRKIVLVAENEPQHAELVRPEREGGMGLDALWTDDLHHAARAAATGRREAYYGSTRGTPQELVSAVKWGYLFQGQHYPWQNKARGHAALDLDPTRYVVYLDDHDQIANGADGARLAALTSPGRSRALTTLLLLAPQTPMLFQGQEFGASSPFLFFADHEPDLARLVARGRREFLSQFPSVADAAARAGLAAPDDPATFARCKLRFEERETNRAVYDLHQDLLRLRREDATFAAQRTDTLHGAVLAPDAFVLRYATGTGDDRLLVVNLGSDLVFGAQAEPLVAPPRRARWALLFSSEDPRYGGGGTPSAARSGVRTVPGGSAIVLAPEARDDDPAREEAR